MGRTRLLFLALVSGEVAIAACSSSIPAAAPIIDDEDADSAVEAGEAGALDVALDAASADVVPQNLDGGPFATLGYDEHPFAFANACTYRHRFVFDTTNGVGGRELCQANVATEQAFGFSQA